jgi:ribose-phosphate pyrophosphokinase
MNQVMKIFSCTSHPALAQAICTHAGVELGASKVTRFSNENIKVKIEDNVRGADTFVVHTSCPPVNDGLMELLITIDALRHASAGRITAVLPYYPYVRSDKKDEPRISVAARLVADLLETAGADRVLTLDLHSPQIHGFFRIPVDHLTATVVLCNHLRERGLAGWVLVAPDAGEVKDAGRFAKILDIPLAIIDKRRSGDDENARAERVIGEVAGKQTLIVDDEVATAGTLAEAVKILEAHGAVGVTAAIVHPVLSGQAAERVRRSNLKRLVVTDSIPIPKDRLCDKITVLSVAPLLGEAIQRIHDGRSLSSLFSS